MEEHWSDERFDLAVTGGTVIDVVGGRYLRANVGIREGKIVCVTEQDIHGARQIDAAGYLVSPGFIDFESHVDGDAYAAQCILRQGGTTTLGGIRRLNGKLIRKIAEEGFLINQGFFVSQAFVLRDAVGIKNPYAPASPREIGAMVDLAARFMECGAFGICFPLELAPGVTRKELLAISQVAKDYDRVVSVHLRKDGRESVAALDEVFEVAAKTGAKLNLLELTYMAGMCGAMPAVLDAMEQARRSGIDITGSSQMYPHFTVCIGTGVFDGGYDGFRRGCSLHAHGVCQKADRAIRNARNFPDSFFNTRAARRTGHAGHHISLHTFSLLEWISHTFPCYFISF